MDDAVLGRLHARIDSLLSELSGLSQRVARMEVQESRVVDNAKDIDRLENRYEVLVNRISQQDVRLEGMLRSNPLMMKSKTKEYVEKGGLVAATGLVIEFMRWLVKTLGN